jgi:hypothetical protein
MRKLIEKKIAKMVKDGADLSELEYSKPTSVKDLPKLSDKVLLDIYDELIGFNG